MNSSRLLLSFGVFAVGCSAADVGSERIAVAERNDLGVVSVEVDRYADSDGDVFELRGLDTADTQVALLTKRIGAISDLSQQLPGDDNYGVEITVDAARTQRWMSREVRSIELPMIDEPAAQQLFELPTVSRLLKQQGIIITATMPATNDEIALTTASCPPSYVNITPPALQCCGSSLPGSAYNTRFINPTGSLVTRNRNSLGTACKNNDGSSCLGQNCYYGPNAFARPVVEAAPPGYPKGKIVQTGSFTTYCIVNWTATPQPPAFPDVTGTFSTSVGCPGGVSGAGQWDY